MPQICLYLHLHQPYRLRSFQIEEIGNSSAYYNQADEDANREVFAKVARKSYYPMLELLNQLLSAVPTFCFSISVTGVFLEQAQRYEPGIIDLLQASIKTGRCEILSETYHHTLASLYSESEFSEQVDQHRQLLTELFQYQPSVFRNTELVYSNQIAPQVAKLGFAGMITEGVDRILKGRPRTQVYYSVGEEQLPLLLKHAQLSDDLAFRFSDRNWSHYPLSVEKYLEWVQIYGEAELVNLFMDFETFGEHQWADTGIFDFFAAFVHQFAAKNWNRFVLPSEVFAQSPYQAQVIGLGSDYPQVRKETTETRPANPPEHLRYDAPDPISWADVDRDLSAWLENAFQQDCLSQLYNLENDVRQTCDQELLADWRRLQTSDHFYYMCTKWSADGDVHAYFSPYRDPYEAYRRYSVVLADFKHRLWNILNQTAKKLTNLEKPAGPDN